MWREASDWQRREKVPSSSQSAKIVRSLTQAQRCELQSRCGFIWGWGCTNESSEMVEARAEAVCHTDRFSIRARTWSWFWWPAIPEVILPSSTDFLLSNRKLRWYSIKFSKNFTATNAVRKQLPKRKRERSICTLVAFLHRGGRGGLAGYNYVNFAGVQC